MRRINEIKSEETVVQTVGDFTNSLQQIAAMRMTKLRRLVLTARIFVEEATLILRELKLEQEKRRQRELKKAQTLKNGVARKAKKTEVPEKPKRKAIIVISSNQGLSGSYNLEVFNKLKQIINDHQDADYFILGKKGQAFMRGQAKKVKLRYFPYDIPEEVSINDLKPLIGIFSYYSEIHLIYSKYINTAVREVVFLELTVPHVEEIESQKETAEGKFIFEPDIDALIEAVSGQIRYALFRQQLLDSKLSLYTAQMVAMKNASDSAKDILVDLKMEYNKARRKIIDKKIQEVQAGRSLWEEGAA